MKILVLQLARLGDIYMTWPALRALRRAHPEAEIHLLVRPRFEAATRGLEAVDRVKCLPTEDLLEPFFKNPSRDEEAVQRMDFYLQSLRKEHYDRVINVSFSPLSSWIVKTISEATTEVNGYSRHTDGFLKISDEVSAYFYGQVGTDRANRFHLTDLFANLAGTDLIPEDWAAPKLQGKNFALPKNYIALHIGASENHKRLSPFQWARAFKHFHDLNPDLPIVAIGTAAETILVNEMRAGLSQTKVIDLTGQTAVEDLFGVIGGANLLVGGDSAPIHMASLTGTPTLNVSIGDVNFWETGPRAPKSWVLPLKEPSESSSEFMGRVMARICSGESPEELVRYNGEIPSYTLPHGNEKSFSWKLIEALYLGNEFPVTDDLLFVKSLEKMSEMNQVVIDQLATLPAASTRLGELLDRADEVFMAITRVCPETAILVRWLQTEKTRIPPGSKEKICQLMSDLHLRLGNMLMLYSLDHHPAKGPGHGAP